MIFFLVSEEADICIWFKELLFIHNPWKEKTLMNPCVTQLSTLVHKTQSIHSGKGLTNSHMLW
jgi:hypothetical protein